MTLPTQHALDWALYKHFLHQQRTDPLVDTIAYDHTTHLQPVLCRRHIRSHSVDTEMDVCRVWLMTQDLAPILSMASEWGDKLSTTVRRTRALLLSTPLRQGKPSELWAANVTPSNKIACGRQTDARLLVILYQSCQPLWCILLTRWCRWPIALRAIRGLGFQMWWFTSGFDPVHSQLYNSSRHSTNGSTSRSPGTAWEHRPLVSSHTLFRTPQNCHAPI